MRRGSAGGGVGAVMLRRYSCRPAGCRLVRSTRVINREGGPSGFLWWRVAVSTGSWVGTCRASHDRRVPRFRAVLPDRGAPLAASVRNALRSIAHRRRRQCSTRVRVAELGAGRSDGIPGCVSVPGGALEVPTRKQGVVPAPPPPEDLRVEPELISAMQHLPQRQREVVGSSTRANGHRPKRRKHSTCRCPRFEHTGHALERLRQQLGVDADA